MEGILQSLSRSIVVSAVGADHLQSFVWSSARSSVGQLIVKLCCGLAQIRRANVLVRKKTPLTGCEGSFQILDFGQSRQ